MAEFIENPRRAPRAPARCRAAVVSSTQGWFEAETEDIGSTGCQLVAPRLVRKGDIVQLHVTNEKLDEPLKASGRVAWVSPQPPWRVGIAFDEAVLHESARWFDRLLSAYPGLGGYRRVPDRLRADATVYLGPPPKFLVDFSADEAMLLRAIASGARLDELQSRLRDRWPAAQCALFSLIARQAVTFQRGHAVHPESWKRILSEVEASLAVEEMGKGNPAVVAPPPPFEPIRPGRPSPTPVPGSAGAPPQLGVEPGWTGAPAHEPAPPLELPRDEGAPLELATPAAAHAPARADFAGAGVGWRVARGRSGEAQAAYDRALAELRAGSVNGAIALLRRALQLAPGDPEIAAALGRLAFKDRTPGGAP
jgi:hypothetical protein